VPDPSALALWGLPGLFLAALLAGSIVPAPSEAVLAAVVHGGVPWPLAVAVATAGNLLGAATLYALGRWVAAGGAGGAGRVGRWVARRREAAAAHHARAERQLRRWGAPVLLLSWLPSVGDAFVLAAGLVGVRPAPFVLFTALGKGLRYLSVALTVAAL
jgi:membrane protein YqaA with SNARE-associated domain